ncbi:hypothetical protein CcCBS67573_g06312 [Chytriomyces confervae]|uniref:Nascent polypeptide-associated complex subunit alpha-like UBA domain-containing protein n=1 Tax=Chytriomyces confervae TaxID=246404 RepID=A0A507F5X9_9FUNG|nr:hypothetical protein HDU80_008732 [Chytriomyces hyalinus]TPX71030.1 hypothetical protein CcCBS67573_g06312 [Chytriomyces confervae]
MSKEEDKENLVEDGDEDKQEELTGTAGQASKDMQSMADGIDPAAFANLDLGNESLNKAVAFAGTELAKLKNAKMNRERELAKVAVTGEDIELIVSELELSKTAAEKLLRENAGNVDSALRAFIEA